MPRPLPRSDDRPQGDLRRGHAAECTDTHAVAQIVSDLSALDVAMSSAVVGVVQEPPGNGNQEDHVDWAEARLTAAAG